MKPYTQIEYPLVNSSETRDVYAVYHYSEYEEWSVLAGHTKRQYLDEFSSLAEAKRNYPEAEWQGEGVTGYDDRPLTRPDWCTPEYEAETGEYWEPED